MIMKLSKRSIILLMLGIIFLIYGCTILFTNETFELDLSLLEVESIESTCSSRSTKRGSGQKVISYAFYGPLTDYYYDGIFERMKEVRDMYPGWVMRVYHETASGVFDKYLDTNPHLDLCYIENLPGKLGNISDRFGMLWRFSPIGDPLVDRFLSRDLDSNILQREVDAVNEWINSKKLLHVMRDHPEHGTTILGGMWGFYNAANFSKARHFLPGLLPLKTRKKGKGFDQKILDLNLWQQLDQTESFVHDSYLCNKFESTNPFPTKRDATRIFVGAFGQQFVSQKCPEACRPRNHTDWEYC